MNKENSQIIYGVIYALYSSHNQRDASIEQQIAVVQIGDEATLKPEKLILSPCNPVYDDFVYCDEQLANIRILGKAVAFLSLIRK